MPPVVATSLAGLDRFVEESNRIEGIVRPARDEEVVRLLRVLTMPYLTVKALTAYAVFCEPDVLLRDRPTLNVRVGDHVAPPGGPAIVTWLDNWCFRVSRNECTPLAAHCEFLHWHPLTDGNGRTSRAAWLWHHLRYYPTLVPAILARGFLQTFYYDALAENDRIVESSSRSTNV